MGLISRAYLKRFDNFLTGYSEKPNLKRKEKTFGAAHIFILSQFLLRFLQHHIQKTSTKCLK